MSNNKSKKVLTIIAIILIIVGVGLTAFHFISTKTAEIKDNNLTTSSIADEKNEAQKVDNPIDFDSLIEQNDDVYAWIKVPGTNVDYPICQSLEDDNFYLKHSATDKSYSSSGALYTQSQNNTEFTDRVTVIYGHNGYGDTYFTTLHRFEKEDFFNDHKKFVIYTPKHKLTYKIVSAFKYDDRHIMNSFDFHSDDVFEEFIAMIQNPTSTTKNVRNPLDKEITKDDNIVVLSTCITNQKSNRYLVCGVLVSNEETN